MGVDLKMLSYRNATKITRLSSSVVDQGVYEWSVLGDLEVIVEECGVFNVLAE